MGGSEAVVGVCCASWRGPRVAPHPQARVGKCSVVPVLWLLGDEVLWLRREMNCCGCGGTRWDLSS